MELKWDGNKTEWEQGGFVINAKFLPDDLTPPACFLDCLPGKRYEAWKHDEWYYGGIVVSVARRLPPIVGNGYTKTRGDIVLAEEALWGIESDSGDEYFSSVAQQLAKDAIAETRQTLKDLLT